MPRHPLDALIRAISPLVIKAPWQILAIALAMAVLMAFAARPMSVRSDLDALLPSNSPSLVAQRALKQRLGGSDVLIITLEARDTRLIREQLAEVAAAVAQHEEIRAVEWHLDLGVLRRNALILVPSLADLEGAAETLTALVKGQVKSALGLLDGPEVPRTGPPPDLEAQGEVLNDLIARLTWAAGQDREYFEARRHTAISLLALPVGSPRDVRYARRLVADVKPLVTAAVEKVLGPVGPEGKVTSIAFDGRYVSIAREAATLWRRVRRIGLPVALGSLLLLALYTRRLSAMTLVCLPTAWVGVIYSGLVSFVMGDLDLMTVSLYLLILLQGIMNGLYLWRTYGEARAHGWSEVEALQATLAAPGRRCVVAALVLALSLMLLMLSDSPGVRRLAGFGALSALLGALSVLFVAPALIRVLKPGQPSTVGDRWRPRPVVAIGVSLLALAAAFFAGTQLQLSTDLRHMGTVTPSPPAIALLGTGAPALKAPVILLTEDAEAAERVRRRLPIGGDRRGSTLLDGAAALSDVLPRDQARRLTAARRICKWLSRKGALLPNLDAEGLAVLLAHCDPHPITEPDLPAWIRHQFTDRQGRLGAHIFVFPRGSALDGTAALALHDLVNTLKASEARLQAAGGAFIWAEVLLDLQGDQWLLLLSLLTVPLWVWLLTGRFGHSVLMSAAPVLSMALTLGLLALFGRPLALFDALLWPSALALCLTLSAHRAGGGSPWLLCAMLVPSAAGLTLLGNGGLASGGQVLIVLLGVVAGVEWSLRGVSSIPQLPALASRPASDR
ncbi:MAG: hypothetical protein ACE366_06700 [Bradymonadia bacterium]